MPSDQLARRSFLRSFATGAASTALAQTSKPRPNIIYIHSHDTGRYLQPYGHAVPAPNIQKLADGGILFRQAFNAAPTCSPSRASLLTGQCPHANGMLGLAHRGFSMTDYKRHIAHTLRAAGYYTELIGLQHIASDPHIIGYDKVQVIRGNHVEQVGPAAAAFLKNAPRQPFFIDVGFQETHREFRKPGPREDPRCCLPPAPLPDTPETRYDIAAFKATARALDDGVGIVLDALESNGLASNTLVISTTDHGIAFPDMKCNLFDHGMGVSLIMRGPGGFSDGRVADAMVSHIDLFPTICELLDIERPSWLEGKSMMPLIRGSAKEINEEIFAEVNYHAAYEPKRAVRTKRWKYIRHYDGRQHPNLPNCDDGPSKSLWLANGWRDRKVDDEQLYDLMFDPNEIHNCAADPANAKIVAEMRGRLDRWMRKTGDPLLKGQVKAPKGAVATDPDATSPKEEAKPVG
jgi:arylsulfatase A-like enzyme